MPQSSPWSRTRALVGLAAIGLAATRTLACAGETFEGGDAGSGDAGGDAAGGDGGAGTGDASSDAGEVDADHYCAHRSPAPAFCMDFDDDASTRAFAAGLAVAVPAPKLDPGTSATLVRGSRSPLGLSVRAPAADAGTVVDARYVNVWNVPNGSTYVARADLRVTPYVATAQDSAKLFGISMFTDAEHQVDAWIALDGFAAGLLVACSSRVDPAPQVYEDTRAPLPDGWFTVELKVSLAAAGPICEMHVDPDGANLVKTLTKPTPPFAVATGALVSFGLQPIGPMVATEAVFDNLTFDGK